MVSLIVALLAALLAMPATALAQPSGSQHPGVVPPDSRAFGRTYGEWSATWWKWAFSIPASVNPTLDPTGAQCGAAQAGRVWFLAGSAFPDPVARTCTVPAGKALLIPIITAECSTVEAPPFFGSNEAELRACADAFIDGVSVASLAATLDGVPIPNLVRFRVQSPLFNFTTPADNILGLPGPVLGRSISDGYWLLLHPLSPGTHVLHVAAQVTSGPGAGFAQDVTYTLIVR